MEITLRKATRLVSKIDCRINELSADVSTSTSKTVFVYDATNDVALQLTETLKEHREGLTLLLRLYDARVTLRNLVGTTNATSGVNELVTLLKGYEAKFQFVSSILLRGKDVQLSRPALNTRLEAYRTNKNATQVSIRTSYVERNDDNVAFGVLEQADLDSLRSLERELSKKSEATHDQLERINNTVTVDLPDDVVAVLTEAEVL